VTFYNIKNKFVQISQILLRDPENKKNDGDKNDICIVCKNRLTKENTKVKENQKYIKYKKIICSSCFKDYYP
jgi:hypothetical protein